MNYIEILSENDIALLQKQSMILLESNPQQLYEVRLIKKIKNVLSQKFKGSIVKFKKILLQAKIKLADFIKYIAQNIKKIKSIKILDIDKLNKEYTKRFSKILNNYITQTNESKKSLVNIFFERNNTEIVRIDNRDKNSFFDSLDIYIPDDPEIKDQIKNIDINKSGDKIRKDLESDKKLGFANNLLQKIKKYEKPVKFVLAIVAVASLVHSTVEKFDNAPEVPNIVFASPEGVTVGVPSSLFTSGTDTDGNIYTTSSLGIDESDVRSSAELVKSVETEFGDIVKTVKTGAYFLYDSKTNRQILEIANRAYEEFNDSNKKHYKYKQKVNNRDFTLLITQESGDSYDYVKKEINDWLSRQKENLKKVPKLEELLKSKYQTCLATWLEGNSAGVACAVLDDDQMSSLTEYPIMISKNNKETIRHESGHVLNDSIAVTKVVKNILKLISDSKKLKAAFGDDVVDKNGEISTIKFQEVILSCIEIMDESDKGNYFATPKVVKDLSDDAKLELKQYVEALTGQFLFDGTIAINQKTNKLNLKSAFDGSFGSVDVKSMSMNDYFNRYNERRQHTNDVLNMISFLKKSDTSSRKSLFQELESYISDNEELFNVNNHNDLKKCYKKFKTHIQDRITLTESQIINLQKTLGKIYNLANSTNSKFSETFLKFRDTHDVISSSDLASALTFTDHQGHDHEHDHQHESFVRLKQNIYSKLLREISNSYS